MPWKANLLRPLPIPRKPSPKQVKEGSSAAQDRRVIYNDYKIVLIIIIVVI
ncbi:hypothetical protein KNP414_03608 [Paenibacillus mucilaginosus KNP414]|uniref:Uncharacterized protein n=1 Tax=Paenibacillus mucilaginosus (strain KNP414) TaxID=1036673 RepID=F8FDI2_PAEMK|nr:hypothetical protein KNP414_03608 [Paenibacillus mucilaginosus KNP414]